MGQGFIFSALSKAVETPSFLALDIISSVAGSMLWLTVSSAIVALHFVYSQKAGEPLFRWFGKREQIIIDCI
jgi:hypothetical protein